MKVDAAEVIQEGFSGPHDDENLHHVVEIALNCTFLDGHATFRQDAYPDLLREYLGVWYLVRDAGDIGGEGDPQA